MGEYAILSVQFNKFKDKTGKEIQFYKCYIADDNGGVGYVTSSHEHVAGEVIALRIAVNNDGKFAVKIVE